MPLQYLNNIEPEEAIHLLDDYIVNGYQVKDLINYEYNQNKATITTELINKWRQAATQWANQTIVELKKIFVSSTYAYNFRDAEISPFVMAGENYNWNSIIGDLNAKIKMLNQYNAEIKTNFSIKVNIVGRDKITVSGTDNKLSINNK